MSGRRFQYGDSVLRSKRPEWGVGSITKSEDICCNGQTAQRLSIRFPNAGLKTLNTDVAVLEIITDTAHNTMENGTSSIDDLDQMGQSEGFAPVARKKIEELMVSMPPEVRDAFNGIRTRLKLTLDLYRFDNSGKGLIDWAVAQSRLDDPLSRFNRHELEHLFDRWSHERDNHLSRLLQECKSDPGLTRELLESAPPEAKKATQRIVALK